MSSAFVPGLVVSPALTRTLVRELPIAGECLVKVGDSVQAEEIVARAEIPGDLSVIRIAEKLAIDPLQVKNGLKVNIGDSVEVGQILCVHKGLFGIFSTSYKSTQTGRVEFFSEQTGHLGLRSASRLLEVKAHISGTVSAVQDAKSVSVQAQAAYIQGIFGVGGERRGRLLIINSDKILLSASDLPRDGVNGSILVARSAASAEFILAAAKAGATGLIIGSIDDQALHGYLGYDISVAMTGNEDIQTTLIVTEGFGRLMMSARSFALLSALSGELASINGATKVRAGAERPEIIVTRKNIQTQQTSRQAPGLEIGASVRIIRVPYFGLDGIVKALPNAPQQIESGVITRVLEVALPDGRVVCVPRANVELIG